MLTNEETNNLWERFMSKCGSGRYVLTTYKKQHERIIYLFGVLHGCLEHVDDDFKGREVEIMEAFKPLIIEFTRDA